jgi:hypothetical protein
MQRQVGLWIDHRKSVIVTIVNDTDVTKQIRSNVEKHVRFSDGSLAKQSIQSQNASAEDLRDKQFMGHLGRYFELVIMSIRDADSIWIFGPGEAKDELGSRLRQDNLGGLINGIDTFGKMTEHQVTEKVRAHYLCAG